MILNTNNTIGNLIYIVYFYHNTFNTFNCNTFNLFHIIFKDNRGAPIEECSKLRNFLNYFPIYDSFYVNTA